jgi:magnesium chelatase accessory protein
MTGLSWDEAGKDWPNRDSSRFVDAGVLRFHVQDAGEGPPLLLLHGTGGASHSWRDVLPLAAQHFRVLAPDLPGHGFTGQARDLSLPGVSAALAALLEALAVRPAMIAGHSAGAAIAIRMALDREDPPAALVSVGGALQPFPGMAGALFPAMARLLFLNPLVPALFSTRTLIPGETGRFLARATGSRIDARGVALYERLFRAPSHVSGALGMMASWDLLPLERDMPRLGVPLLLLHGEADAPDRRSARRDPAGPRPSRARGAAGAVRRAPGRSRACGRGADPAGAGVMDPNLLGLVELVLVFGGVLAFAVWQLRDVSKAQRKSRTKEREKD